MAVSPLDVYDFIKHGIVDSVVNNKNFDLVSADYCHLVPNSLDVGFKDHRDGHNTHYRITVEKVEDDYPWYCDVEVE